MRQWVQGMREAPTVTDRRLAWEEVLFRRLTGSFNQIPTGPKTAKAESEMEMGRNVYYYVGRAFPGFGQPVAAFDPKKRISGVSSFTTPFDTGGLHDDMIPLTEPLDLRGKKKAVETNSYMDLSYETPMSSWIGTAFKTPAEYTLGERPTCSAVSIIDIKNCMDRAWTWEGRIPATDYDDVPLEPMKIFMRSHFKDLYLDWVSELNSLDDDAIDHYVDLFETLIEVADDPVGQMTEYILEAL